MECWKKAKKWRPIPSVIRGPWYEAGINFAAVENLRRGLLSLCKYKLKVDKIASVMDCPVVLCHLPTSDRGIHFSAPPDDAINSLYYKYGKLDNPIAASNSGARYISVFQWRSRLEKCVFIDTRARSLLSSKQRSANENRSFLSELLFFRP